MKALLVYPEHPPHTYWSFSGALPYIKRRAAMPPLGLVTVAECVEDESAATMLQDMGVDWAQGYHFGRPAVA